MKSVGEVMAIGRTWQESLQKALRGMEAGLDGWSLPKGYKRLPKDQLYYQLRVPNPDRIIFLKQVCLCGPGISEVCVVQGTIGVSGPLMTNGLGSWSVEGNAQAGVSVMSRVLV
jgi:hypothetical protein